MEDTFESERRLLKCIELSILLLFCDQTAWGGWVSSRQKLGEESPVNCRVPGSLCQAYKSCLE